MKKLAFLLLSSALLTACASAPQNVDLIPMAGSKAGGVVNFQANYAPIYFHYPVYNKDKAQADASRICHKWGYKQAEAFGGISATCTSSNQYGCMSYQAKMSYQCVDE